MIFTKICITHPQAHLLLNVKFQQLSVNKENLVGEQYTSRLYISFHWRDVPEYAYRHSLHILYKRSIFAICQ